MNEAALDRLFGVRSVLDDRLTQSLIGGIVLAFVVGWTTIAILKALGKLRPEVQRELEARMRTWAVIIAAVVVPLILGAGWVILAVGILGIFCYQEFARATGLFRHPSISVIVLLFIVLVTLATFDHWYGFFVALPALGTISIAAFSILTDQPRGYIQRVGLGCLAFLLFGVCLGHLGYLANDANYRSMILLVLVSVSLNDVFAYLSGKSFGRRKLLPATSPGKTVGGALGALVGTTLLVSLLGSAVFAGTPMDSLPKLIGLGLVVSLAGQLGDLVISSVKRDLGIKDMGTILPGHGGLLDRFDSLLLVAPAFFHYVGVFMGIGLDQPAMIFRIIHGG